MPNYYTGMVKHGTPMGEATKPYMWTADGEVCVGSNGVPVFGAVCGGQSRPALACPSGYVVVNEPVGVGRKCVPASEVATHPWTVAKLTFTPTTQLTGVGGVPKWLWLVLGAVVLFILSKK